MSSMFNAPAVKIKDKAQLFFTIPHFSHVLQADRQLWTTENTRTPTADNSLRKDVRETLVPPQWIQSLNAPSYEPPPPAMFVCQQSVMLSLRASSDWPPLVWHHGRWAPRTEQGASTAGLQLLERPTKPNLPSADDPGNMRTEVRGDTHHIHSSKFKCVYSATRMEASNVFFLVWHVQTLVTRHGMCWYILLPGHDKPAPSPILDCRWSHSLWRSPSATQPKTHHQHLWMT